MQRGALAEKDLKTGRLTVTNDLREAGETGVTHGSRIGHDRRASNRVGRVGYNNPDVWPKCVAKRRGLQGEWASSKVHGGTRPAKGQTTFGDEQVAQAARWPATVKASASG
jgi:hypothetical protein